MQRQLNLILNGKGGVGKSFFAVNFIQYLILRALPKHTAVLVHCEHGFKRTVLPPIEPNGRVSRWFRRRWL
jgi:cellulose biosynthesis protein BcsQ